MADELITTNAPWGPQQAPLEYGFGQARGLYDAGAPTYFPDSTVAQFGGDTQDALNQYRMLANSGAPLAGSNVNMLNSTLQGDFLGAGGFPDPYSAISGVYGVPSSGVAPFRASVGGRPNSREWSEMPLGEQQAWTAGNVPGISAAGLPPGSAPGTLGLGAGGSGNPYLDATSNAINRQTTRAYQEATAPGIQAQFANSGRTGSGLYANALDQSRDTLGRSLFEGNAALYGGNYQNERNLQMQASQLAPQAEQQSYFAPSQLLNVGETFDQKSQQNIQDQFNRYNFNENTSPYDHLGRYMGYIRGNYGGEGSQVGTGNELMDAFGLASTGFGLAQELFGL